MILVSPTRSNLHKSAVIERPRWADGYSDLRGGDHSLPVPTFSLVCLPPVNGQLWCKSIYHCLSVVLQSCKWNKNWQLETTRHRRWSKESRQPIIGAYIVRYTMYFTPYNTKLVAESKFMVSILHNINIILVLGSVFGSMTNQSSDKKVVWSH